MHTTWKECILSPPIHFISSYLAPIDYVMSIISFLCPKKRAKKIPSREYPLGSKSVKQLNINFRDAAGRGAMQINGPASSHQCRRRPLSLPRSPLGRAKVEQNTYKGCDADLHFPKVEHQNTKCAMHCGISIFMDALLCQTIHGRRCQLAMPDSMASNGN